MEKMGGRQDRGSDSVSFSSHTLAWQAGASCMLWGMGIERQLGTLKALGQQLPTNMAWQMQ